MNRNERYIVFLQFKLKIYQSEGQAFEDFFADIMRANNPNFSKVKAYGNFGDRKNDGFDKTTGKYYQVFAPENIAKKTTEYTASKKLREDFNGLYNHWNKTIPIKEFYFVINDKYKSVPAFIQTELAKIEDDFPNVKCDKFGVQDLQDIFFQLSEDKIFELVGIPPNINNIQNVDIGAMGDVIDFLLNREINYKEEKVPDNPNFDKKIQFNQLSSTNADLLKQGYYQFFAIRDYFKYDNQFARDELRQVFSEIYSEGRQEFGTDDENNDLIFHYILNMASPNKKRPIVNAVLVLMSYYFEYCDIFEAPEK